MPTYQVTGKNGQKFKVTAPEGTSMEDIAAGVQQQINASAVKEASTPNVSRVTGAILKRGLTDLPKFFASAIQEGGNALEKAFPITPERMKVQMADAAGMIDKMTGGEPGKGKNAAEQFAIEAGAGALSGGLTGLASAQASKFGPIAAKVMEKELIKAGAIGGVGAGVGGEAGKRLLPDNPLGQVGGAIVGGLATGPASYYATGGGPSRRVNTLTKGMHDVELEKAKNLMLAARDEGIDLNVTQAVQQPTSLTALSEDAAQSSAGTQHLIMQRGQTAQAQAAGKKATGMFALPEADPTDVAFKTQQAAEAAIKRADKLPATVAEAEYAFKTPKATTQEIKLVVADIRDAIERIGSTTDAGEYLQEAVLSKIIDSKNKSFVYDMQQLKTILKAAEKGIGKPTLNKPGMEKYSAGLAKEGLQKFKEFVRSKQVDPKTGDTIYSQTHEAVIDPMKRGPVGQIATPKGVDESIPTKVDVIFKVLDSPNVKAQTISRMQVDLDKSSPGTFAQYAKSAMERKLEVAFKGDGGKTPLDAPAKFSQAVWGGPDQVATKENFRATMNASARSLGKSPQQSAEFVRGMEKLMQVIEAAGRNKVIKSGPQADKSVAIDMATDVARGSLYTPAAPSAVGRTLHNLLTTDSTRRKIFDMIWTPEGVDQIRKYAALDIGKIRETFIAGMVAPASSGE